MLLIDCNFSNALLKHVSPALFAESNEFTMIRPTFMEFYWKAQMENEIRTRS